MARIVHIERAVVGVAVKETRCERCKDWYQYRLVRRAACRVSAPDGTDEAKLGTVAHNRAAARLAQRLEDGVDPVPCPGCGWFQAEMVDAYRREHHGWVTPAAVAVGLLGALALAVAAWGGRDTPRGSVVLWLGGAGGVAAAVALPVRVRPMLRKLIDPNRGFPHTSPIPGMPRGFRPGYRESDNPLAGLDASDPDPDALVPTLRYERVGAAGRAWVTVQVLRIRHPRMCCACLAPTRAIRKFRLWRRLVDLPVRMCPACQRRYEDRDLWSNAGAVAGSAALATGAALVIRGGWDASTAFSCSLFGGVIGWALTRRALRALVRPVWVADYRPLRNVASLRFRNPVYHAAFAAENP